MPLKGFTSLLCNVNEITEKWIIVIMKHKITSKVALDNFNGFKFSHMFHYASWFSLTIWNMKPTLAMKGWTVLHREIIFPLLYENAENCTH